MKNFWQGHKKPIFCLAPMENVTDTVFRRIVAECGKVDVFFTEFTNVEGICSKGRKSVAERLIFTPKERSLIAQLWGLNPEHFYESTKLIGEMGFDGVDINMGCPVRDVVSKGACSGLIKNPSLAKEIVFATQKAAKLFDLPVSVKTRVGYSKIQTEEWISFLLGLNLDGLIIHARTVKEMSKVPAHWDEIGKVVQLRNKLNPSTVIIGNGDVMSIKEAQDKVNKYGVDGVMIGRGIFHNPWLFNPKIDPLQVSKKDRLELLLKHAKLFVDTWGDTKDFNMLKKFFKIYVSHFNGASDLRIRLMETKSIKDVEEIVSP